MATDFPAFVAMNHDEYEVGAFKIDSANAGKAGSLCFLNTSDDEIEQCGADPANILGLMTGPYTARTIYPSNKMPVIILDDNVIVGMCSATTPADTHLEREYGIVKLASGNWAVDTSDTTNKKVLVVKVDITAGIFYVKFKATALQGDPDNT